MRNYFFSLLLLSSVAQAQAQTDTQNPASNKATADNSNLMLCQEQLPQADEAELIKCVKQQVTEQVTVIGARYIGLEASGISGRFHLDKSFIEQSPRTSGDINDLIALLPGVEMPDSAYSIDALSDVRAKQLSISGGQPWQTGFFLDGMNYNSRQDPNAYDRSVSTINDVQGSPQTYNVNSEIVQSIDVYDNNIPADYGDFSGGVVSVASVDAFYVEQNSFSLGYRGTKSTWGQYHIIESDDSLYDTPLIPVFDKQSYNVMASHQFNQHHGLVLSGNYLTSTVSDTSLGQVVLNERTSSNVLVKYSQRDTWIDSLDWSVIYAPYENKDQLKNVKDSALIIDGGGFGSTLNLSHQFDIGEVTSKLQFNTSDNSRQAADHYYIWRQTEGKDWGQLSSSNSESNPYSLEGGYGSLDKEQQTASWKNTLALNSLSTGALYHDIKLGFGAEHEQLDRLRDQDSYYYNSALTHTVAPTSNQQLNCSGYQLDCVELAYYQSIADLELALGHAIDYGNASDIIAYSNNIAVTPQYFESRIVYGAEDISVDLLKLNAFVTDKIEWGNLSLNLGLRLDYDDFFENFNIAPRTSLGYDIFSDNSSLLILGASRYYDAGLLTYKVKELQLPYYVEYRDVDNGYLQGWQRSSSDSDYRYRYENLNTPYNDELVVGWKQSLAQYGHVSLKLVARWQKDQLARAGESFLDTDGYRYIAQDNSGSGTNRRISLAWSGQIANHSLWANTSYSTSETNSNGFDRAIDDSPIDDLVIYEGETITRNELERINSAFGTPLSVKFGINSQWTSTLKSSISATYTSAYDKAVTTGDYAESSELINVCNECTSDTYALIEYTKVSYSPRVLVNLGLNWDLKLSRLHKVNLRADISNVFNTRTYTVSTGGTGIEVGRQFWLAAKYHFN